MQEETVQDAGAGATSVPPPLLENFSLRHFVLLARAVSRLSRDVATSTPRHLATLLEGARFLWSHRLASYAYAHWRLGTVYGSFDRATGKSRPLRDLFRDAWRDRHQVLMYLAWRRRMRASSAVRRSRS